MKSQKIIVVSIALALISTACTTTRTSMQADTPVDFISIEQRKEVANALFKQHDYHASLLQWKILNAIQPDNPEYKNRIRVLEALIKRRSKIYLRNAQNALEDNDLKTAEWELQKVLALNPENNKATEQLKHIEALKAQRKQARKTQRLINKRKQAEKLAVKTEIPNESNKSDEQSQFYLELGIELFNKKDWRGSIRETKKYLSTHPNDKNAIKYLSAAHIEVSKIFEERGHLEPAIQHLEDAVSLDKSLQQKYRAKLIHLKQKLSASYYIDGIKVYRDNIDQAISYWQRAIEINPQNEKAKIRLRKAEKMKQKLNKIQPD